MRRIIIPAAAFFLAASTAFANTGATVVSNVRWSGPAEVNISGNADARMSDDNGMHRGMSTSTMRDMKEHGPAMAMAMHGIVGTVASVGSDSFTLTIPRMKDRATTTLTVNVSNGTTYKNGSSTAAFADLAAGTHIAVEGKASTSTKIVTAEHVMILDGAKLHAALERKGFMVKIKNFIHSIFHRK